MHSCKAAERACDRCSMKIYAAGMYFGEGPRWHEGALWMSDPQTSKLWTDASGTWSQTSLESTSNGLWFLPDGRLVAAMTHEKRIGLWQDDHFETYVDLADIANGPLGDMTGDSAGNLYVDDVGYYFGREEPRRWAPAARRTQSLRANRGR